MYLFTCGCISFSSCSFEENVSICADSKTVEISGREIPVDALVPGVVRLKVTEELFAEMSVEHDEQGYIKTTGVKSLDDVFGNIGVVKIERTFPYAGKFEARTRAEGLHLWFNVWFDEETALSRAGEGFVGVEGIVKVEYRPRLTYSSDFQITYAEPTAVSVPNSAATEYFNDPGLAKQWHYYNDGHFSDSAEVGADINVFPVWRKGVTGNSDVIVCVVDKGVDFTHEDLKDNMWVGHDEEGNEIYGYNFINDNTEIIPGDHGTHIAGTIAAVSNNGIGVAGIAGGDKARGVAGVKIMSCQIASDDGFDYDGGVAIKWSADHGAVISQNSWQYALGRYNEILDSDREGIDYFIKYAGLDENGVQVGPMAGGVVFFAGGNSSVNMAYPQSYEKVIAVSGLRSDFKPASYNNFGSWVDIAAPGGAVRFPDKENRYYSDNYIGDGIFSTLPPNKDGVGYGFMAGTSMACPHAVGVAALIVSHFGGQGFTNDELKFRMLSTLRSIDAYTPNRIGDFGRGLIDADNAIFGTQHEGPGAITDFAISAKSNKVTYSFTLPTQGNKAVEAFLLYSKVSITEENFRSSTFDVLDIKDYKNGDVCEGSYFLDLFDTDLYAAVVTVDADANISNISNCVPLQIGFNHAPVIEAVDGDDFRLSIKDKKVYRFVIKDEDGHTFKVSIEDKPNYIFYEFDEGSDTLNLTINGKTAKVGDYTFTIRVEDVYMSASEKEISYIITEDPEEIPEEPSEDEDITEGDFAYTFYPNPVQDYLFIKSVKGVSEARVLIYSSAGSLLVDKRIKVDGQDSVDMSGMPGGVYTVKVVGEESEEVFSVVKL